MPTRRDLAQGESAYALQQRARMMRRFAAPFAGVVLLLTTLLATRGAHAQSFGIELHNTLMPASGGMGGVSLARPQDLLSGLNGNPATMSQFDGTQFTFSGAWADPNIRFTQNAALPVANVTPFSATSSTPGMGAGNIGLTQNFTDFGMPVTLGLGLISGAGGGIDFRKIPESNGTSSELLVLQFVGGVSAQLTDQLSAGATASLGEGFYDAPFAGIGAMTPAYGARGSLGLSYQLTPAMWLGAYYQTREQFDFRDAIRLALPGNTFSTALDVKMGLPDNFGVGIADNSLMDGKLLLAVDVLFKQWDNASLYRDVYRNQWVLQTGAQYSSGSRRYRLGYVFAENPVVPITNVTVAGISLPDAVPGADYLQAQTAVINQHRVSAGFGVVDVLPGVNFDVFAGGMFRASQSLGPTTVAVSSYYLGAGFTWRFSGCSGMRTPPVTSPCAGYCQP
jgi:long-chain fatty acid transport protein